MRIAGFGCLGCGGLIGLAGAAAIVAALIPGVVNSSETGTAFAIGGSICGGAVLPLLVGTVLVVLGGKSEDESG